MTVPGPDRPRTRLEVARDQVGRVLGPRTAERLATFDDGTLYVRPSGWARILAWLVDFVVFVLGTGVAVVVLGVVDRTADLSDTTVTLGLFGALFLVPVLYGLCYGNGRALGAVLAGTQLVRVGDGGRIGGKAWWAMLVRTLLMPLLLVGLVVGALSGESPADGQLARTSIDRRATRRLHAAGFRRLG